VGKKVVFKEKKEQGILIKGFLEWDEGGHVHSGGKKSGFQGRRKLRGTKKYCIRTAFKGGRKLRDGQKTAQSIVGDLS